MRLWMILLWFWVVPLSAQEGEETSEPSPMTLLQLGELIERLDPEAQRDGNIWTLRYDELPLYVIADDSADRMRIMSPIVEAAALPQEQLYRVLQANFESALDARYAIAQGVLWSAYLHPLGALSEVQFFSGMAQTLNLVSTFGASYSSGSLFFQGGDGEAQDELQRRNEEILRKGLNI